MTKGISGDALIPAKRAERANITRCAHVGESTGALEISRGGRARADTEFLKNTINIDKYMKRFMAETIQAWKSNSVYYMDIIKYYIK